MHERGMGKCGRGMRCTNEVWGMCEAVYEARRGDLRDSLSMSMRRVSFMLTFVKCMPLEAHCSRVG